MRKWHFRKFLKISKLRKQWSFFTAPFNIRHYASNPAYSHIHRTRHYKKYYTQKDSVWTIEWSTAAHGNMFEIPGIFVIIFNPIFLNIYFIITVVYYDGKYSVFGFNVCKRSTWQTQAQYVSQFLNQSQLLFFFFFFFFFFLGFPTKWNTNSMCTQVHRADPW